MKVRVISIVLLAGVLAILAYLFQQNDFLPSLLRRQEISAMSMLLGVVAAFLLGAIHALSPGHGKTLVAAYLVGSRGTVRHALMLGGLVTFTHTISVFLLGLSMLFLSQYILPEKVVPWLGAISGVSIVVIGLVLLRTRSMRLLGREIPPHHHHHGHHHDHEAPHSHSVRLPDGEITAAGLIALGVSGGLVPCPSALVLLLSAIAIGRTGFGLFLLVAFSLGLAVVLMAIGFAVVSAKGLIPEHSTESRFFQWVPVLSAIVIVCVGLLMTGTSLGFIKPLG